MAKNLEVIAVPLEKVGLDDVVLNREEAEYWSDAAPPAIVFASSSLRKAILLAFALSGFNRQAIRTVPFLEQMPFDPTETETPMEFQVLLEKTVRNGDGELEVPIFVGVFQGVPVYMVPQTGETDKNDDPLDQSKKKVENVRGQLAGKNVIVFGSDTTGLINGVHLGKPRNYGGDEIEGFPQGFQSVDPSDPGQVEAFKLAYLKTFYALDTPIVHNNGLYASRGDIEVVTATRVTRLELVIRNVQDRLAELEVLLESGGGGLFQQFMDWRENLIQQLSDELMRSVIESLPEDQQPWAVLAHIMGMPAWALPGVIEEMQREYVELLGNANRATLLAYSVE